MFRVSCFGVSERAGRMQSWEDQGLGRTSAFNVGAFIIRIGIWYPL